MPKSTTIAGIVLLLIVLLPATGCDDDDDDWGQVGFVQYLEERGNCWVIIVENGQDERGYTSYEPRNLPARFRVHNLWIRFEYIVPEEWSSTCMAGQWIILTRIEEI